MSTVILSQCWPLQCSPTAKLVLISLADQANDDGFCWPSVESMIVRTGLSERAIQGALKGLEASRTIMRKRRRHATTVYLVTPHLSTAPKHERVGIAITDATRDSVFASALNSRPAAGAGHKSRPAARAPIGAGAAGTVPAARAPKPLEPSGSSRTRAPMGGGARQWDEPPLTAASRAAGSAAARAARAMLEGGGNV